MKNQSAAGFIRFRESSASFSKWLLSYPASGYRGNSSGELGNVGYNGYYWSAIPYSTSNGRSLYFYSSYVNPLNDYGRSSGFPVRPVQEFTTA